MTKNEIWDLLKWMKAAHYLPQTEATLQDITDEYSEVIASKNLVKADVIKSVCDFCGVPLTEQTDRCDRCWDEYSKKVKQTVL